MRGRPGAHTPSDPPQYGDVVRNADDPESAWAWAYLPDGEDDRLPYRPLVADDTDWCSRADLPGNLTLLVRRGRMVES